MDRKFLTVLGVSLVFALVVSALFYTVASRTAGPREKPAAAMINMVAAAVALPVGIEVKPSDVKLVRVPRDRLPKGAYEKAEEVVGRAVISNILLDDPILAGRLAERGSGFGLAPVIPNGMRAVAVKVNDVVGVAGFVIPGMRVDVLATVRPTGDSGARTSTVLQNIVVLSAGQQIEPDSSGKAVNVAVVTLLVTPEQAEIVILASGEGRIQLVLRNSGDQVLAAPPGREISELYGRSRPALPVAKRAASPAPPAPAPVAVAAPPPDDLVLVIRGAQASVERIGGGKAK